VLDFKEIEDVLLTFYEKVSPISKICDIKFHNVSTKSKRLINRLRVYLDKENKTINDLYRDQIKIVTKNSNKIEVVTSDEFF
jgi:hypothetical protein